MKSFAVLIAFVSFAFSGQFAAAKAGDYPNWGPEPAPVAPARSGSGIACGPWDINDYGSHEEGKTSVTIFTKIKARPDLGYLNVQYNSDFAHQAFQVNNGRCACMDYTWTSTPDEAIGLTIWDFQPASEMRDCPPQARRKPTATPHRRRR